MSPSESHEMVQNHGDRTGHGDQTKVFLALFTSVEEPEKDLKGSKIRCTLSPPLF